MKLKHIIVLGIVFLVLLGVSVAKNIYLKPEVQTTEYESLKVVLNPSEVYVVELASSSDEKTLRIEKKEGEWFVPAKWNMPAKKERIENVIKDICDLEGELRSSSKKVLDDYGISDDKALSIALFGENQELVQRFYVGNKRSGSGGSFLRKADSAKVYLINRNILALFGIFGDAEDVSFDVDAWLDLTVEKIDPEVIDNITITRRENDKEIITVELKKELDQEKDLKHWVSQTPFSLDAKKIKDFLKGINDIRGTKTLEPEAQTYGFDAPYLNLRLGSEDMSSEVLLGDALTEESEDRYIKNSKGHIYELRRHNVNKLTIDIARFFVSNPLRVDKDTLNSIVITNGNEKTTLDEELIGKNETYIEKLKNFSVENMLFENKYAEGLDKPFVYSLEITRNDGEKTIIDVASEGDDLYAVQLRDAPGVFKITKATFNDLFNNLSSLDLEKETPLGPESED